jgi:hypothetical protein
VALLLAAPVVHAVAPARNGPIVMGANTDNKYPSGNDANLIEVDPKTGRVRTRTICKGVAVPDRRCRWMSDLVVSPSGAEAAAYTTGFEASAGEARQVDTLRWMDRRDGSVRVVAVSCSECSGLWFPQLSWYPDGSALAVSSPPDPNAMLPPTWGIHRLALNGVEQEQVVSSGSSGPAWSAQGTLAFVRDGDLFTVRPGQDEHRLTWRGASTPAWSPRGTQIAFTRCAAPLDCDVYVVSRAGGTARRVERNASEPAWSPDGRYIAFLRDTTPKGPRGGDPWPAPSLFRLDRRTGKVERLTPELVAPNGSLTQPQWTTPLPRSH